MQLYSPSVKVANQVGVGGMISGSVFGDHDKVEGKVIRHPNCSQNGPLNISIEGVFEYVSVKEDLDDGSAQGPKTSKYKHIFLSSSAVIPVSLLLDPLSVVCDMFRVP
ncbi:uncharacterized protein BJ212DRAFT_869771 [Suillus subaureus]|uniref:Uncharacterized protein n=1 Tax=Suillus subaureus TaxID=48587 RepID=A0A9P7DG15_9AGAM|nr:uncharacterized protein BJ212DRAFT_869771 [Suillus subaureus]KAG1791962.1 hypothetical protein BJ212DRAFT_869771 [Suillus subaureus]